MTHFASSVALLSLLIASPAASRAQDTVVVVRGEVLDASSRPARLAVARFNGAQHRFFESTTIGRGERILGNVAIYDGRLVVSGVVVGDIIAVNADVQLEPDAEVVGQILIVGGLLRGLDDAIVSGNTSAYSSRALVERVGDELRLEPASPRRFIPERRRRRSYFRGEATIVLTAPTYNRVEGLPVGIGPRFTWGDRFTRFSVEALGILRTAGDLNNEREDLGYAVQATAELGERAPVTLGVKVYDQVVSIEDWQLRDDEIGLATFLWHRDFRDYYLKRGVTGFIHVEPATGFRLTASIGRSEETSASARDPWTPFQRDEIWRPNPIIDEGTFTTYSGRLLYDVRQMHGIAPSGWYLSAEWERGISDDIVLVPLPSTVRSPTSADGSVEYDRLFVDLRRYGRIGWSGQLAFRAAAAGSFGRDDLPVQRRLSLGGPEPMPGFAFRRFACNANYVDPASPALCDRMVLLQAQYRGDLSFSTRNRSRHDTRQRDRRSDWEDWDFDDWIWFSGPTIVLFADAGTAWLRDDDPGSIEGDVGAGIEMGGVGIYAAKALTEGEHVRVLLRLHRRF